MVIADAKLTRIESDAQWAKMNGIRSFSRDHGNLLINRMKDGIVGIEIGYLHEGISCRSSAAQILQHASPDDMVELVRGYRLAKEVGLIKKKGES